MGGKHHGKAFVWSWELKRNVVFVISGAPHATLPSKPEVSCVVGRWSLPCAFDVASTEALLLMQRGLLKLFTSSQTAMPRASL